METELISVIVPVYNVEPYLRRCVDSVLHQTYQDLEVLLVMMVPPMPAEPSATNMPHRKNV